MFSPTVRHMRLEHARRAGKVHARQIAMRQAGVADHRRRPGQEVDDAVGQPGLAQDLHDVVRRQHRRVRRLPHHRAAHHRRRRRQVGADRREVERRDREDEALERARLELVPHARRRVRLLGGDALGEVRVPAPEVDRLAGGVDLGLVRRLRLPEHRRRVHDRTVLGGQQLRRAQEDREPLVDRRRRPRSLRRQRRVDGAPDILGAAPARPWRCTFLCACGERTSADPVPLRRSPPTNSGMSTGVLAIVSSARLSAFFSGDPGP